ncbi:Cell cycle serine/threonine-protein kinase cdc5/MSD2 [Rhizina undulata]
MMLNQQAVLTPLDANLHNPTTRKPSSKGNPSPLRKQSDYQLVAPLSSKKPASARPPPPAPSSGASKQPAGDPKTPKAIKKDRKKFLCATPPTVLQDTRGKTEYDRGRQLGEGGFARCFLVQNKEGELFAAKTVSKKSLSSSKMKAKFFGEIQVHKTMNHPNIVKFVECFEDAENIYMILELCPNKSLMDMLRRRKRFTEYETRFFLLQLLGALKYMHGKRVIHRDLKLGNIFLDENMNIKIGDFGLAALLMSDDERKKTICGTPNYIAPEVLFGGGKEGEGHSFEVDLWGVGVIMYAMLVGKPPFQSTDVDSIYKKIRQNTFTWPEDACISSSAKSLVNALLNRDPNARPTLEDIANHHFFKSGFFPRSIPSIATKLEPSWYETTGQGIGSFTSSRREWKRNFDEVAAACGIGNDLNGNSRGDQSDRGIDLLTIPPTRPTSAASSISESRDSKASAERQLEREKRKAEREEAAKKRIEEEKANYILPETLSPRDGHARMRNIDVLKTSKVPSLLGPSRGGSLAAGGIVPSRQAAPPLHPFRREVIEEDTEEEEEVRVVERPRPSSASALQQLPLRRVAAVGAAAAVSKTVSSSSGNNINSVFPPRRPVTRSHAADMRAANAPIPPPEPVRQQVARIEAIVEPRREFLSNPPVRPTPTPTPVPPENSTNSVSLQSHVSKVDTTKEEAAKEEAQKRPSPPQIPFTPNLSSKIGVPIDITATSAVLASLRPFVTNLCAFSASRLTSLPPQPSTTEAVVKAFKRGDKNRHIFITKWVDYTNKYGVAYILSDGTCGALFNDNTSFVVDSVGGERVEFITNSYVEGSRTETVLRRLEISMDLVNEKKKTSKSLTHKVQMWRRFGNYMKTNLGSQKDWSFEKGDEVREVSIEGAGGRDALKGMVFVTHYARMRRCAVFRFLDGGFQFNFVDHTKLLLSSGGRTLRIITKDHQLLVLSLEEAHAELLKNNKVLVNFGLKEKIGYVKEMTKAWLKNGKFPRGMDVREGTDDIVVLGEALL